jgi:hypothetical protein
MPRKTIEEWSSTMSYLPALDGDEWYISLVSLDL